MIACLRILCTELLVPASCSVCGHCGLCESEVAGIRPQLLPLRQPQQRTARRCPQPTHTYHCSCTFYYFLLLVFILVTNRLLSKHLDSTCCPRHSVHWYQIVSDSLPDKHIGSTSLGKWSLDDLQRPEGRRAPSKQAQKIGDMHNTFDAQTAVLRSKSSTAVLVLFTSFTVFSQILL